jgi:two-component sensor histidine kinase
MSARDGDADRSAFSIVSRLRTSLSLVIVAVSLAAIGLLSFNEASRIKVEFASKIETLAHYLGSILEAPIWNYDDAAVAIVGSALFRDEDVAALRIEGENGRVLFDDRRPNPADISRTVAVAHGDRRIGLVEFSMTYHGAKARFLGFLAKMAASMAAVLAATLVLASYLIRVNLKRPLGMLSERVTGYAQGRLSPGSGALPIAEFSEFGQVLDSMASRILEQLSDLRSLNRELEEGACEKDELIVTLRASEERLARSVEEKSALLRELYHRTKNNMQVICSMLSMRSTQIGDEAAKAIIGDAISHIHSMALVHEMLYESHSLSSVDLGRYLDELARRLVAGGEDSAARVTLSLELTPLAATIEQAIPIGLVVTELLTNSMRHAGAGRERLAIRLSLSSREGLATLRIADDGPGFAPGFDWRSSSSMGLRIIGTLADQLRAGIEFESGEGLRCSLSFRIEEQRPVAASDI